MVMAILVFAIGVILSTLREKDRQDFEYRTQKINMICKIMRRWS